jgi:hypothetical protein
MYIFLKCQISPELKEQLLIIHVTVNVIFIFSLKILALLSKITAVIYPSSGKGPPLFQKDRQLGFKEIQSDFVSSVNSSWSKGSLLCIMVLLLEHSYF